jgi:NAD(P)-dependent dehydrogenase (short-subunit alcohol dehydrogenase family)
MSKRGAARRPVKADGYADLEDRYALVTGATSGIGFSTARRLATRGATVLVTGRDPRRGAEAAERLQRASGHDGVEFIRVDHSTVNANVALAEELRSRLARLDLLVNNVGGLVPSRVVTRDGNELTLALNFVTPVVLTESLAPLMAESDSARCVNVISSSFKMAKGDPLEDLQFERSYAPLLVLARAKFLALVWTAALADRYRGGRLSAVAVNPGMAWTPGTQALTREAVPAWRYIWPIVRFFQRRADPDRAGAACEAVALASASEIDGRYFDGQKPHMLPARVLDPELRQRVLQLGQQFVDQAVDLRAGGAHGRERWPRNSL